MRGETIRKKLKKDHYQLSVIAKKMKISPQSLNSLLDAADIKTGVLEKIAKAINKNLYYFFESDIGGAKIKEGSLKNEKINKDLDLSSLLSNLDTIRESQLQIEGHVQLMNDFLYALIKIEAETDPESSKILRAFREVEKQHKKQKMGILNSSSFS